MLRFPQHLFCAFFFSQMTSCAMHYDVIYRPFPINSQYLKTWGVDSPALATCVFLKQSPKGDLSHLKFRDLPYVLLLHQFFSSAQQQLIFFFRQHQNFLQTHDATVRFQWSKRVRKGIFGIRDLTKIRCGNRENDKYIDRIRDLTVPREPPKIGHGMRDLCLSVCREWRKPSRPTGSSGQSELTRRALSGVSFQTKHPMECLVNRS